MGYFVFVDRFPRTRTGYIQYFEAGTWQKPMMLAKREKE
jgi:hypothetical protein